MNILRWMGKPPASEDSLENDHNETLHVITKATRRGESSWITVATGTWKPGYAPQLSTTTLPEMLIDDLFSVKVAPDETSGRTTAEFREFSYAMEWHR